MSVYTPVITPKTKFLNFFRKLFTVPLLEKSLVKRTVNNSLVKLIPPEYLYKSGSFRYANRGGINYKLDISNIIEHYIYFGMKDNHLDCIIPDLKNAKVILDIGANIGNTSMYFSTLNPAAQIISFEPHPDTYKRAKDNLQLNDFKNIDLVNLGLGNEKSTLKLYVVNEHNPGSNRIMTEEKDLPFKIIAIDTLDNVMESKNITKVDVIKIDVEGFEYSVLTGGKNIIMQSMPVLYIELDDDNLKENKRSAKELVELLTSFGYKKFYRSDNLKAVDVQTNFTNSHYDIVAIK